MADFWPELCLSVALQEKQPTDITHLVTLQSFSQQLRCVQYQHETEEKNLTGQVLHFHIVTPSLNSAIL